VTAPVEVAAEPPAEGAASREHAYRAGVLVALLAVVGAAVLLPVAAISVVRVLQRPVAGRAFQLTAAANLHGEWTKLNVSTVSMSEAAQTITLRVTGFHNCPSSCPDVERVQLFSVHADPTGALGAPPSATVDLPKESSEVDQQVTLPMEGNLSDYPFDHYHLLLGVTFAHLGADGNAVPFSRSAAGAGLALTVNDDMARATMGTPRLVDPERYDAQGADYDTVAAIGFSRPAYLQILAVDLTLLIVIAAIYGVIFRPFTQIIPTVGGTVLGVWGVRSLLVGSYPPDSTGVDLVLEAAVFLVLLLVGVRSVLFMWPNTHFARNRGLEPPQTEA
jgi:hypothetical protein